MAAKKPTPPSEPIWYEEAMGRPVWPPKKATTHDACEYRLRRALLDCMMIAQDDHGRNGPPSERCQAIVERCKQALEL